MANKKWLGTVSLLVTMFIWGISFINIKIAVAVVGPMTLGLLRFAMALVILWGLKLWKEPGSRVDRKDWGLMTLAGFLGITVYFFFENNGVKLISAGSASIIVAAIPIANVLAEALAFRKPLSARIILCALLSLAGVAMVTGIAPVAGEDPLGYWLMGGAVLSWVLYCLVSKGLFERYSSLTITFYQTLAGTLMFIPFVFFEENHWAQADAVVWINIVILGVFASALGFYLYLIAMDQLGIAISSLYLNLIPVFTLAFGVLILSETLGWGQLAGCALVIASVVGATGGRGKG